MDKAHNVVAIPVISHANLRDCLISSILNFSKIFCRFYKRLWCAFLIFGRIGILVHSYPGLLSIELLRFLILLCAYFAILKPSPPSFIASNFSIRSRTYLPNGACQGTDTASYCYIHTTSAQRSCN